jgi:hypothetical protein
MCLQVLGNGEFPHAATTAGLAGAHALAAASDAASADRSFAKRWRWVLSGGQPPASAAAAAAEGPAAASIEEQPPPLYVTGHQDGRVRAWDMRAEVPALLATVPFDAGGAGAKLRPVCALQARGSPLLAVPWAVPDSLRKCVRI